ncbi:hypothetical protein DSO57_1034474 [Entomophthora muscae]|uniref:Uncharacterized protein n=1 Tax=Entomophthora muscae TaxID=34485 RepID=A0ACC2REL4_9FUNG|nr:hypothetical protein DSO57_1034474 [Entomophthora muscae]
MPSGTLEVTIVSARKSQAHQWWSKPFTTFDFIKFPMTLIFKSRLGPQKFKTEVRSLRLVGRLLWNQTFHLGLIERSSQNSPLRFYDQDRMIDDTIGKTTIPLEGLLDQGETDSWFTVGKGSNATGEVHARILFKPGNFPQGFDPQAVDWESHAKLGGGIAAGALALAAAGVGAKYAYDKYGKKEGEENEPLNEPHN